MTARIDDQFEFGMLAAFSGPSRGLGIEFYREGSAYFEPLNWAGDVRGRNVALKRYDDGYQPAPSVENTITLVLGDRVIALFGHLGTPTATVALPVQRKLSGKHTSLFHSITGARPEREPPYGDFAFNLRASYR